MGVGCTDVRPGAAPVWSHSLLQGGVIVDRLIEGLMKRLLACSSGRSVGRPVGQSRRSADGRSTVAAALVGGSTDTSGPTTHPSTPSADLSLMEAEVRAIKKDGLLWGACKFVPIGYGIKKMQITAVIEDAKVESMDAIIEEELVRDGESETIQSIDVVSFNKL